MSTSPDARHESSDHTADSGQLEVPPADADTTAAEADTHTAQAPETSDRDETLTEPEQPDARHDIAETADEADPARSAAEQDTTQKLGHHALAQPADAAEADPGAGEEDGDGEGRADKANAERVIIEEDPARDIGDRPLSESAETADAAEPAGRAADVSQTGPAESGVIDHTSSGVDEDVDPVRSGVPDLDISPAAFKSAATIEDEDKQAGEADDQADSAAHVDHAADEHVSDGAAAAMLPEDGATGDNNGSGPGKADRSADDAPEADMSDATDGEDTTNPDVLGDDLDIADDAADAEAVTGVGDDIDYDLGDYIDDKGKGNADPAQVEHERVMTELQDRIDHANRMADHIQHAQDMEALGGFVDPYLANAAREASEAVQAYLDRYPDDFADVPVSSSVEDDVTRWTYDSPVIPDTDTVPPLQPDTDTNLGDRSPDSSVDDPDVSTADTWKPFDFRPEDDPTIDVGDVDSRVPMPDDPKGGPKTDYEEVKTLGGAIMDKVWGRLSELHERVVTRADDRTIERLRILDNVLKVDLYKVTHDSPDIQRSAYYLATGRTGFRGGIQRGFREQQPVALKREHGSDVRASNIIARQTRRQDVIQNTRGSVGLRTFAQVVKSTYDAKQDAHQSKLIYKHERTNARYDLSKQRQALHQRHADTRYERGPRGDRLREDIRAEFRELRDRERALRQHHRNVRRQSLGHRAVRTGGHLTGKAAVGSAKLGYKAAKGGARHGYKAASSVARRTNDKIGDLAAKRAAERTGAPEASGTPVSPRTTGAPRPPRDPGTPRSPATPRTPGARRGASGGRRAGTWGRRGAGRPAASRRPRSGFDDTDK